MTNILFIERNLSPTMGGVERVTYLLSKGLEKIGYSTFFFYYVIDSDSISNEKKYKFQQNSTSEEFYQQLFKYVQEKKIDHIVCQNVHFPHFQIAYKRIKQSCNIKFITCFHGSPDMWVNKNKWGYTTNRIFIKEFIRSIKQLISNPYKKRMLGMYELSDKYILLSKSFIPVFQKLYQLNDINNKLYAISNPCTFLDTSFSFDHLKKKNQILVVSRMAEQQKRISNVLKIWEQINKSDRDWNLILVGDGPDLEFYKNQAKKKNLKRITFVGHSDQVAEYYKQSKIFLMTSIWEGFGMTLVEAQYYGCIPIAFDTYASLHDIIKEGDTGSIIPKNNMDCYIRQLKVLMGLEDQERLKMGSSCHQNTLNNFSINTIIDQWDYLFKSLK